MPNGVTPATIGRLSHTRSRRAPQDGGSPHARITNVPSTLTQAGCLRWNPLGNGWGRPPARAPYCTLRA